MFELLSKIGYKKYNHYTCYKELENVTALINWDSDYFLEPNREPRANFETDKDNLELIVKDILKNNAGIYNRIVCFYTPLHYKDLYVSLEDLPFRPVFIPELLFLEVQRFVDVNKVGPVPVRKHKKLFCFLNNRTMAQRKELFNFFLSQDLLDISYATYLNLTRDKIHEEFKIDKPYRNFKEDDICIDIGEDAGKFYPVHEFVFDVCVETYCMEKSVGLTEKSIKPFLWGHIPLIFGPAGTYRYLENLGFDTFTDIIDTDFDLEQDIDVRMHRFQQEILRLSKIPINTFDALHPRFIKNQNCYIRCANTAIQKIDWIEADLHFVNQNRKIYLGY